MENKSNVVFVLGMFLVVAAAGRGVGWDNLRLDLTTAPSGWQDAQRRVKLLSPYLGVLGGVIVATFASSLADEVGSFFIGTEALILLLIAVNKPSGLWAGLAGK